MENKEVKQYVEETTNPHKIVSRIEEEYIPYNRQELYHTAHNRGKFRPIDYFFLSMYSKDEEVSVHAQAALFCIERGESLERTMDRIRKEGKKS